MALPQIAHAYATTAKANSRLKDALIGVPLLMYGLLKIFVGTTATMASPETKAKIIKKIPAAKAFYSDDETLAAAALEYNFIIFGLFSLLHGLDKFHVLPPAISHHLESKQTEVIFYAAMGSFLTVFYTAVVYTDAPIPKNPANRAHYKLLGIVAGLSFLIMVPFQVAREQRKIVGSYKALLNDSVGQMALGSSAVMSLWSASILAESVQIGDKNLLQDLTSVASILVNGFM